MPIKIKLSYFRGRPKTTLIVGIALIVAAITTYLLLPASAPPSTEGAPDEQEELNPPSRIRSLGTAIKGRFQRIGDSIKNSFSYLSNFIVNVLLPRLSPQQRERLYSVMQTASRIKEFFRSNFYLILTMMVVGVVAYIGIKRYKRKA
ncbi:MAG: hypothetical protein OEX80_10355 [Candidatus Aminicenantes bacterium]|nr:hypothetical protein [Candidatus Aminicenantes bacterium]